MKTLQTQFKRTGLFDERGRNGDATKTVRVLYLSYDGALEPLGQSQVLPYLRGLAARGVKMDLLTFEKPQDLRQHHKVLQLKEDLMCCGIEWTPLRYHKKPTLLATSVDILRGVEKGFGIVRKKGIKIVHARSYVPALIAWLLGRLLGVKFIFDMRGFWGDERVEAGMWRKERWLYRLVKYLEKRFLIDSDYVVTLTGRAKEELENRKGPPRSIAVIPTCVDLNLFLRERNGFKSFDTDTITFVYSGSLGTLYLIGEMLDLYTEACQRFPQGRFLLLTRSSQDLIQREMKARAISPERISIRAVEYGEIPRWLNKAHVGLSFYRPGFSAVGRCPTKVGEYLACGLPVVINRGIGDTEEIFRKKKVGVVIDSYTPEAYRSALSTLEELFKDPDLAVRCRETALKFFSLKLGLDRYWDIYRQLAP